MAELFLVGNAAGKKGGKGKLKEVTPRRNNRGLLIKKIWAEGDRKDRSEGSSRRWRGGVVIVMRKKRDVKD